MSEQIKFFRKNFLDVTNDFASITITDTVATYDGQDVVKFMQDRKKSTAWLTTGSNDSANTIIESDWKDLEQLDEIIIIGHNFKNFLVEYYNGASWIIVENITGNEDTTYKNNRI